jgi:hypothetical protein
MISNRTVGVRRPQSGRIELTIHSIVIDRHQINLAAASHETQLNNKNVMTGDAAIPHVRMKD